MVDDKKSAKGTTPLRARPTVFDLARHAGVSTATVSRALNKPDTVRESLRLRVENSVAELGYVTSSVGKALRKQRTRIIGTLLPKLDDPLFSIFASGVQSALVEAGYVGFIQPVGFDNRKLTAHARTMIENGAEGIIVFGRIDDPELFHLQQAQHFPLVSAYSYTEDSRVPCIGIDNYRATRQLIDLLLQLGHRRIAMLAGPTDGNDRQQTRIAALTDAMREHDLPLIIENVDLSSQMADAAASLRRLLGGENKVSAILCSRDVLAFRAMAECNRMGIRVPEDLSLTGFDDLDYAELLFPPLTTLAVPAVEIGRHAARQVIAHLDENRPISSYRFDTAVMLRQSVGRPGGNIS